MGLLESLGNWLENVASASTEETFINSTSDQFTPAESRTLQRASNIRAVGQVLNGKHSRDYSYDEEED